MVLRERRETDPRANMLEFYLHVYFAVFPVLPAGGGEASGFKKEVAGFVKYLEAKGTKMSTIGELAPFYILPYVEDPRGHPAFAAIFKPEWTASLRTRLAEFLTEVLPPTGRPEIFQLIERDESVSTQKFASGQYETLMEEKETARVKLIESQAKWTTFSRDILAIAKDLYTAAANRSATEILLKTSAEQIAHYDSFLSDNQALFGQNAPSMVDVRPGHSAEEEKKLSSQQKPHVEKVLALGLDLNLSRTKVHDCLFTCADPARLVALLHALRWRVLRIPSWPARKPVVDSYISMDLLDCTGEGELLEHLLNHPNPEYIQISQVG